MAHATLSRLAGFAQDQWGLVTRRQAEGAGVSQATIQRLSSDGILDRIAPGVYQLSGAPVTEHRELRAAWLQLAPDIPAWKRSPGDGVVSHRSAAALFGLGDLSADKHDFILPVRRQTRRSDVHLHLKVLEPREWTTHHGLPVTRPARTVADLLATREDPEGVGHIAADAMRGGYEIPAALAAAMVPLAKRNGLRSGDGLGVLRWLLDLTSDPAAAGWIEEAYRDLLAAVTRV